MVLSESVTSGKESTLVYCAIAALSLSSCAFFFSAAAFARDSCSSCLCLRNIKPVFIPLSNPLANPLKGSGHGVLDGINLYLHFSYHFIPAYVPAPVPSIPIAPLINPILLAALWLRASYCICLLN